MSEQFIINVCLPHFVNIQLLLVNIVKWLFWLRLSECLSSGCVQVLFWIAGHNIVRSIHGFFNIVICCFKYGTQTFDQQCCPMCLKFFLRFGATFSTPLSTLRLSWKNLERCPLNISHQGIVFTFFMITVKVLLALILAVILGTRKLIFCF